MQTSPISKDIFGTKNNPNPLELINILGYTTNLQNGVNSKYNLSLDII